MSTVLQRPTIAMFFTIFAVLAIFAFAPGAASARLALPQASPRAKLMQKVGLTQVSVDYSRPAVRKRRIWGKLVPYGKVWRTGANKCTLLTFGGKAKIGGKGVEAGSYCLFTIPRRGRWTVMLSKNTKQWGSRKYKPEQDAARFDVKPKRAPFRERLTFLFSRVTGTSARLDVWWGRLYVPITIEVDTNTQALANIKKAVSRGWRTYAGAARYLLTTKQDYDRGLRLIDQALKLKKGWFSLFIKAQLLRAKGQHAAAYATLKESKSLGDKAKYFFWRDRVEAALGKWKRK